MPKERYWAERRKALAAECLAGDPDSTQAEVDAYVEDAIKDEEYDAHCDRQEDIAMGRYPGTEDSPCLANCDDAGTGEGRWHGRM